MLASETLHFHAGLVMNGGMGAQMGQHGGAGPAQPPPERAPAANVNARPGMPPRKPQAAGPAAPVTPSRGGMGMGQPGMPPQGGQPGFPGQPGMPPPWP